jgi:hypothetical protein
MEVENGLRTATGARMLGKRSVGSRSLPVEPCVDSDTAVGIGSRDSPGAGRSACGPWPARLVGPCAYAG